VRNVGIAALGDFQGLWEEGEGGQLHRPAFHAFHQTGISTAIGVPLNLRANVSSLERRADVNRGVGFRYPGRFLLLKQRANPLSRYWIIAYCSCTTALINKHHEQLVFPFDRTKAFRYNISRSLVRHLYR
jgi:hypothetical protein